jgi:hypothetical protein
MGEFNNGTEQPFYRAQNGRVVIAGDAGEP